MSNSKKGYGLKVSTVLETIDYLVDVRDLCETYILAYDTIEQLENIREFRLMCALVTSITEQLEWIYKLIKSTKPDSNGVIPLDEGLLKDLKYFSEKTNKIFETLKYDYNKSFIEH